jgi:GNT-I family
MKQLSQLAPIAVFVFKRPEHTRRTLESLVQNPEFTKSPLFVYCDGARNGVEAAQVEETRQLVRDWPHPNKTIIERDRNWGLANSVITGVTDLCKRFGRVIVVEDDLVVSPVFLNYLNAALVRYADEPKVMQVSAHMFPMEIHAQTDAVMLPFTTSWGWATWDRAWKQFDPTMSGYEKLRANSSLVLKFDLDGGYPAFKMLERQKEGKVDSWAIRWYLSVFLADGWVLFPKQTLVMNEGFDGSGSNCKNPQLRSEVLRMAPIVQLPNMQLDEIAFSSIKKHLRKERFVLKKLMKYVGAL